MKSIRNHRSSRFLGVACFTIFTIVASVPLMAQPPKQKTAATASKSMARAQLERIAVQMEWHKAMINAPVPHEGCFKAEYPIFAWQEVQCVTPPNIPMPPRRGPQPFSVGNGY